MDSAALRSAVGSMDIYLLDQLLRGRISDDARVFDAGCGGGRNIAWFLRAGNAVAGVDRDPEAVERMRALAARIAPSDRPADFRTEPLESHSFPESSADLVICSAILHFAEGHDHFRAMLDGAWKVLAPGGLFFCRLASRIGMDEDRFRPLGYGRYTMPDGSDRYLVDESMLLMLTRELGGILLDPLKTTVVQDQRCMTTWVVRREDLHAVGR